MLPRKVVEWTFLRLPLLILPILLAPTIVLVLRAGDASLYRSEAVVWVADTPGLGGLPLGSNSPYLSASQRHAGVMVDLLSTQVFREATAVTAGLVSPDENENVSATSSATVSAGLLVGQSVSVRPAGLNVLVVSAVTTDPFASQAIVAAVLEEYDKRLAEAADEQAATAITYLNEQIPLAQRELDERRASLDEYVTQHPNVLTGGTNDVEYQSLRARVEAQDTLIQELQQALQDWHLTAAGASTGQAARFQIQDQPYLPLSPLPTGTVSTYGFPIAALGFGVFIAAAFVYMAYRLDHTIRSSEDLTGLGVPVLGIVPSLDAKRHHPWYRVFWHRKDRDFSRRVAAALGIRSN